MSAPSVVIKKYENRRLYDTSNSRYVNLDDIAQMVREGTEIRVIDAATGEDLTRLVLTQIIMESAKVPDSAFPVDMLRQMVIASGRLSQEGLRAYMKTMLDLYQNTYRAFAPGLSPLGATQPEAAAAASMSKESGTTPGSQDAPVDELRRRIEDLERLVAKTSGARPRAKRKPRSRPKN
ncbi:MAG: polyhydroxyalkanoate synthesis regulator DNA-binding domain-containing protein [Bryobacteraceae bacterium]